MIDHQLNLGYADRQPGWVGHQSDYPVGVDIGQPPSQAILSISNSILKYLGGLNVLQSTL